jgi:FdrA protein
VYFSGLSSVAGGFWYSAATLEEAALGAVALLRGMKPAPTEFTIPRTEIERLIGEATHAMQPDQLFVRGIYAGGTLAYEALGLLQANLPHVAPKVLTGGEGHFVVDLGEDQFTRARPHPMLDATLRREWILKAADDPRTAVILLDIILGYGTHRDPAGELLPTIQQATRQARLAGRHLTVVASVGGTEQDPQNRLAQIDVLRAQGIIVMPSNAQAARLAASIAAYLQDDIDGR